LIAERSCERLRLVGVIYHARPIVERQACDKIQANVDGQLGCLPSLGEMAKSAERLLQVSNRLAIGAPLNSPKPWLVEIGDRLLPKRPDTIAWSQRNAAVTAGQPS
jgi:hypothetical protein